MPTACVPGYRPWRAPAGAGLALAPPHWAATPPPRPRRRARRTAVLVAATWGLAAVARAQVAPDTGGEAAPAQAAGGGTTGGGAAAGGAAGAPDATPGSLRAAIENVLPGTNQPAAPPNTAPAWTVTPGISLQEQWTDNALNTPTDHKSSLITVIAPSLSINGATSRLTADLYYAPTVELYSPEGSQNQVGQNLGADALLTLAPDEFYVKAGAFAAEQSLSGATATPGTTALAQQNAVQTYNFSIEPYVTHRFGGWGTAQVGVSASQTSATAVTGGTPIQSLTTRQEFASFKSGENLGRLSDTVSLSATQDTGTGALQGASQNVASDNIGYALTRDVILLGSFGWEDIRYGGQGAVHYADATWSFGLQLLPNPDSSIVVTYGHQDGATALAVDASYAPTASIRLFATYSAGVSTAAQSLNNVLSGASFDANGHPIDSVTGAALLPTDNFFGFNGTVYQSKTLALTAAWLLKRDSFQAAVNRQTQTPVGNQGATGVGTVLEGVNVNGTTVAVPFNLAEGLAASSGTYGTLSWEHDLNPVTTTNMSVQYGILNNATPLILSNGGLVATGKQIQNARLIAFTAGVNWQMTRTLTGSLQYSYTSNDYSGGLPGVAANLVILGLRKTF